MTATRSHFIVRESYQGDHWTPPELTLTCGCGAHLADWQATYTSRVPDLDEHELMQEHLEEVDQ